MERYEIVVKGQLDQRWAEQFSGLALSVHPDGTTRLSGPIADQAALHGMLARIRDMGLPLLLVRRTDLTESDQDA